MWNIGKVDQENLYLSSKYFDWSCHIQKIQSISILIHHILFNTLFDENLL